MTLSPAAGAVRVLVVDDSYPFRAAARQLIDETAGFDWIGEASTGEAGVEQALRLRPDLVLMDVRMPGIGGIEAASRIADGGVPSVVVLVTGTELPDDVAQGVAADILAKRHLTSASLRRVWEHPGSNAGHARASCS